MLINYLMAVGFGLEPDRAERAIGNGMAPFTLELKQSGLIASLVKFLESGHALPSMIAITFVVFLYVSTRTTLK